MHEEMVDFPKFGHKSSFADNLAMGCCNDKSNDLVNSFDRIKLHAYSYSYCFR